MIIRRITSAVGTGSPQAIVVVENDIWFIDQVGQVQRLSSVQEFGSIGSANLSDIDSMNSYIRRHFDIAQQAAKVRGVYYARKRECFPPEYERKPGVDYASLGRQINLGNPFD